MDPQRSLHCSMPRPAELNASDCVVSRFVRDEPYGVGTPSNCVGFYSEAEDIERVKDINARYLEYDDGTLWHVKKVRVLATIRVCEVPEESSGLDTYC